MTYLEKSPWQRELLFCFATDFNNLFFFLPSEIQTITELQREVELLKREEEELKGEVATLKPTISDLEGQLERNRGCLDEMEDDFSLLINHSKNGLPLHPTGAPPPPPKNSVSMF